MRAHEIFALLFLVKCSQLSRYLAEVWPQTFLGKNARVHVIIVLVNGKSRLETETNIK